MDRGRIGYIVVPVLLLAGCAAADDQTLAAHQSRRTRLPLGGALTPASADVPDFAPAA
jgi:hypothetical protein